MTKKRRYQPRVFDGRVIESDEIERIHEEVLSFERIDAISDPMRRSRCQIVSIGSKRPSKTSRGFSGRNRR
jgi:hypothetical protein